ncbi:MAG: hypothetical protein WKF95_09805 [Rubrobacter sp.]
MTHKATTIEVTWDGPYGWPGFESDNNLHPIPQTPGVYLQTFEYEGGYLIYGAGLTRQTVPKRCKEHTRKYMKGEYNVLDIAAAQQGVRKRIWHGWTYASKHREEFEERKSVILDAVRRQLAGFRIFVTDMGKEKRVLERLEASIMNNLYRQPSPICDIPDGGMHLAPRWRSEDPIIIKNGCAAVLHGVPAFLEI